MSIPKTLLASWFMVTAFGVIEAQEWPQFRGPNGNGVVEKIEHPRTWSADQNIAWRVELPGGGLSSPIVSGDRILVTSAVGAPLPVNFAEGVRDMKPKLPEQSVRFTVSCLKMEDGSKLWETVVAEGLPKFPIHGSNSFATETPATDGERFFVYFAAMGIVAAMDFDGNEIWRQDIGAYPTGNGFGSGSSLACGQGHVFVQCDNDDRSFVVAFDCSTGEPSWRSDRAGRTSWSTPLLWENENRTELIACGSGYVTSYEPRTGKQLWKMSGISSAFSASPASDRQRVYFGNSGPRSSGPLLAVTAKMSGEQEFTPDAQLENLAWSKMQAGPGMASPMVSGEYLYVPGRGILTCYSAKDGSVVYKKRLPLKSMVASMWGDDDRVYLLDENGKTLVLATGPSMEIVATNQIDDLFWSTPAIAGESLLLRGVKTLYCIRE